MKQTHHEEDEIETVDVPRQDIPHDVLLQHILVRLPIKTLIKFKSVSKQWHSSISSDNHFANIHFKLSPFASSSFPTQLLFIQHRDRYGIMCYDDDDDEIDGTESTESKSFNIMLDTSFDTENEEFELVGSCNGLVCLASGTGNVLILWNPVNQKFQKYYADPASMNSFTKYRVCWGFGYLSTTDDYKFVRIIELPETEEIIIHVFSLRTKKWKKIPNENYQHIFSLKDSCWSMLLDDEVTKQNASVIRPCGVSVDDQIYWLAGKIQESEMNLVAFELDLETFQTHPHLRLRISEDYADKFLCVMGGCLSKCGIKKRGDVTIAMLKASEKLSSIRVHRDLRLNHCVNLIGFTRTGKFFVQQSYEAATLAVVDPTVKPMKYRELLTFHPGRVDMCSFVPSLILPFDVEELPMV